jgi:hypothetical protein
MRRRRNDRPSRPWRRRRIEARIGQLLGPAERGRNQHGRHRDDTLITELIPNDEDRANFRLLARFEFSNRLENVSHRRDNCRFESTIPKT